MGILNTLFKTALVVTIGLLAHGAVIAFELGALAATLLYSGVGLVANYLLKPKSNKLFAGPGTINLPEVGAVSETNKLNVVYGESYTGPALIDVAYSSDLQSAKFVYGVALLTGPASYKNTLNPIYDLITYDPTRIYINGRRAIIQGVNPNSSTGVSLTYDSPGTLTSLTLTPSQLAAVGIVPGFLGTISTESFVVNSVVAVGPGSSVNISNDRLRVGGEVYSASYLDTPTLFVRSVNLATKTINTSADPATSGIVVGSNVLLAGFNYVVASVASTSFTVVAPIKTQSPIAGTIIRVINSPNYSIGNITTFQLKGNNVLPMSSQVTKVYPGYTKVRIAGYSYDVIAVSTNRTSISISPGLVSDTPAGSIVTVYDQLKSPLKPLDVIISGVNNVGGNTVLSTLDTIPMYLQVGTKIKIYGFFFSTARVGPSNTIFPILAIDYVAKTITIASLGTLDYPLIGTCISYIVDSYQVIGLQDEASGNIENVPAGQLQISFFADNEPINTSRSAQEIMTNAGWSWSWDGSQKGTGLLMCIIEMTYNAELGFLGSPQVSIDVISSRSNPADCIVDYLSSKLYGAGQNSSWVDSMTNLRYWSNQIITSGLPRYRFDGTLTKDTNVLQILYAMGQSCGAYITYSNRLGIWKAIVLTPTTQSVMDVGYQNIIGEINFSTTDLNASFNEIEIQYTNLDGRGYPGDVIFELSKTDPDLNNLLEPRNRENITLSFTNSAYTAEFIGRLKLRQTRADQVLSMVLDYTALQLDGGDIIDITIPQLLIDSQPYIVSDITPRFLVDQNSGEVVITCKVELLEFIPEYYEDPIF